MRRDAVLLAAWGHCTLRYTTRPEYGFAGRRKRMGLDG